MICWAVWYVGLLTVSLICWDLWSSDRQSDMLGSFVVFWPSVWYVGLCGFLTVSLIFWALWSSDRQCDMLPSVWCVELCGLLTVSLICWDLQCACILVFVNFHKLFSTCFVFQVGWHSPERRKAKWASRKLDGNYLASVLLCQHMKQRVMRHLEIGDVDIDHVKWAYVTHTDSWMVKNMHRNICLTILQVFQANMDTNVCGKLDSIDSRMDLN